MGGVGERVEGGVLRIVHVIVEICLVVCWMVSLTASSIRDGSAEACYAQRQKVLIKFAVSSIHRILTPGSPVQALIL